MTSASVIKSPLGRHAYFDSEWYEREKEVLFSKRWVTIGLGAQIAEAGAILPCQCLGGSMGQLIH